MAYFSDLDVAIQERMLGIIDGRLSESRNPDPASCYFAGVEDNFLMDEEAESIFRLYQQSKECNSEMEYLAYMDYLEIRS